MCNISDEAETLTNDFDMVRSTIFNIYIVKSVIIAKLRTQSSPKIAMCEYKIDTGSNRNLMSIKMFKILFPNTKIQTEIYL